jgi:biopolymer transport protein ExbB/TolQ
MAKKRSKNLLGLIASAAVVVAAPVLGLLVSTLLVRSAFDATTAVDPSEKARILAEGISESMNSTATGLLVSLVALVVGMFFAVRLYREVKLPRD